MSALPNEAGNIVIEGGEYRRHLRNQPSLVVNSSYTSVQEDIFSIYFFLEMFAFLDIYAHMP